MSLKDRNPYGRAYNPNRFNTTDSALAYILVLSAFYFIPLALSWMFKSAFNALYKFDYYAYASVNAIVSQSIILLSAAVFAKLRRVNPFDGGGYRAKFDGVAILMGIVLIMGVMLTFYYVHLRFGEDAEKIVGSYFPSKINQSDFTPLFFVVYLALISVLPAIIEEMMFRGIIMRGLESFGAFAAVIISSMAFSLMHGNFSQLILQFFGGIAIGTAVILTKNQLVGIAMHFFNNLFSTAFTVLISTELITEPIFLYVPYVTDAACIVIGITCLIVGSLYFYKLALKVKNGDSPNCSDKNAKRYVVFLSGVAEFKSCYDVVELGDKNFDDGKRYYICGKMRKMNRKSNAVISSLLLATGGVIAIALMFI